MARTCTVCSNPNRADMDKAIISGESLRNIAKRYGVSYSAVNRHKEHIPAALTMAQEALEISLADNLLDQVRGLQSRALDILGKAEGKEDLRVALLAIKEARGCLELLGKLACELQEHPLRIEKLKTEIRKAENLPPTIDVTNFINALKPAAEDVWGDEETEIDREIALELEGKDIAQGKNEKVPAPNGKQTGHFITSTTEKYSPEFTEEGIIRR